MAITDSILQARQKGASDDQIIAEIIKQNPQKSASFTQAQKMGANSTQIIDEVLRQNGGLTEPQKEPGFLSRVKSDFQNRGQKVQATVEDFSQKSAAGQANLGDVAQSGFNVAGQFAGGALDIVGEGIKSIIPKAAETGLTKLSNKIADVVTENPRVLAGLNKINESVDSYSAWAKENPEDAKSLEGALNIGLLFGAAKGDVSINGKGGLVDKAVNTTKQGKDLFASVLEKQKTKATLTAEEKAYKNALDRVVPDYNASTPTQKKILQNQKVGTTPRVNEGGVFKGRTVNANSAEKQIADELVKVPGYNPKLSNLEVENLLNREISREADILRSSLEAEQIIAPKKQIFSVIKNGVNNASENSLLLSKTDPVIENYLRIAQRAVSKNNGTLRGALNIRQELDAAYKTQRGKLAYGSDRISALDEIHYGGRDALNDFIANSAKSTDVKASLAKQSKLYKALDQVGLKAAKEGGSKVGRFAKKHPKTTQALKYGAAFGIGSKAVDLLP